MLKKTLQLSFLTSPGGVPQDSLRIVDYAVQFVRDLNKMEAWKANSEIREMGEISD